MTDSTNLMLCTIWATAAGYSDEIMRQYAKAMRIILEHDKLLQGQEWNHHRFYENDAKYFEKKNGVKCFKGG